ncbi:hypothetical protein [Luteimonas sp. A501]
MKILAVLMMGFISHLVLAAEPTTAQGELMEASCSFMLSAGTDKSDFVHVPGLKVLHPSSSQAQLNVELDAGVSLEGVVCWRSLAEIGPNDDWVARTGVPLYIKKDSDDSDSPTLVLELTDPGYRVRIVSGPELSSAQAERTISLIDTFNERR